MKLARAILRRPRASSAGTVALILSGIGLAGCYITDEGLPPPKDRFYFPTGIVISPGRTALYVANSDFDLQFNGGTVQVLDLRALREIVRAQRDAFVGGEGTAAGRCANPNADPVLYPGPCAPIDSSQFVRGTAVVGAFASGLILTHEPLPASGPTTHARLFAPVRGDPSLTYFDVDDDRPEAQACVDNCFSLDCGSRDSDGRCNANHRVGESPSSSDRHLELPSEPIGIAADPSGELIVLAHQSSDQASLFTNRWAAPTAKPPELTYVTSNLASLPTEVASVPPPRLIEKLSQAYLGKGSDLTNASIDYQPGFLLTYRGASELDLLRYTPDAQASPPREFLSLAAAFGISTVANGNDSRGIAIDAGERQVCEQRCSDDVTCLAACVAVPLRIYVAHRSPSSLLVGEVTTTLVERKNATPTENKWASAFETITIRDSVPLAAGASRVVIGQVVDKSGALQTRVFAVAFDSGLAFSYDPMARRIDAVIRTGRGPHAIAFDTEAGADASSFMYIAHFTDSYIGVVDLDMRKSNTFGSMIATLGTPVPPRGSQ